MNLEFSETDFETIIFAQFIGLAIWTLVFIISTANDNPYDIFLGAIALSQVYGLLLLFIIAIIGYKEKFKEEEDESESNS